jgi:intracellular multiplication protein IcmO
MAFDYRKYEFKRDRTLIDPRNHFEKFKDKIRRPHTICTVQILSALFIYWHPWAVYIVDLLFFYNSLYFAWFFINSGKVEVPFRLPKTANRIDPGYKAPGTGKARMAEGILFLGNEERSSEEVWFTNTDARTHILYLGTTGSGKTEGLKALATNALGWGSGFIYVDGKADTDLWGSISALARRFGRDDDLLVLNYMTGNSDNRIASNTVNPFSQGSASYLTNLLVSLMPEVQGDNAMWKDRAVALISALMPVMTWLRTHQEVPLNISTIREALNFKKVIEYSRRPEVPERLRKGVIGYLDTLPGYTSSAFNDDGTEKPNPSGPPMDYSTIYQQHGYLAMQFTRQLQSLADDYGYIFEAPSADIDMMDVVLNRRILVVLIPALEKSADETANLGKIIGSMLKGMMGATLGSSVEGDTDMALENKPTRATTPFMAIFDEVGYYTTQGMAVMAAQARSLGFSLVFAGQDLPALEKRVKEEARSITANCNIKIFGKLEDPTQTKEFFEKTVGETSVVEAASRKEVKAMFGQKKLDKGDSINVTSRVNFSYGQLKDFKEGQAVVCFGSRVVQTRLFYSNPGKIKSLRVNKFIPVLPADPHGKLSGKDVDAILERVRDRKWTAQNAVSRTEDDAVIKDIAELYAKARHKKQGLIEAACIALVGTAKRHDFLKPEDLVKPDPSVVSAAPATPEKKSEEGGRREPFVEMPPKRRKPRKKRSTGRHCSRMKTIRRQHLQPAPLRRRLQRLLLKKHRSLRPCLRSMKLFPGRLWWRMTTRKKKRLHLSRPPLRLLQHPLRHQHRRCLLLCRRRGSVWADSGRRDSAIRARGV